MAKADKDPSTRAARATSPKSGAQSAASTSSGSRSRRAGLGKGLGALIPEVSTEDVVRTARPIDVFFPERSTSTEESPQRASSHRDLLNPRTSRSTSKSAQSRRTSKKAENAAPTPVEVDEVTPTPVVPVDTPASAPEVSTSNDSTVSRETSPAPEDNAQATVAEANTIPDVPESAEPQTDASSTQSTPEDVAIDEASADTPAEPTPTPDVRNTSESFEAPASTESDSASSGPGLVNDNSDDALDSQNATVSDTPAADNSPTGDTLDAAETPDAVTESADTTTEVDSHEDENETSYPVVEGASFAQLPLEWIIPNSRQPREYFDEEDLTELSDSIKEVGVLQPIVVRPISTAEAPSERLLEYLKDKPDARFELIMGERRLRASERAGLPSIPAIIRQTEDGDLLRDALLENLHRAQLNPLEEAAAYQQLLADFGTTQEELSRRIARSRPQIANTLRLLKLPAAVQTKVAAQVISAGHARALLALQTPEEMEILADRIVSEGLSVRTTEELVRLGKVKAPRETQPRATRPVSSLGQSVIASLQHRFDTRVQITEGRTKGKIVIEFAGPEDLQRIADIIGGPAE